MNPKVLIVAGIFFVVFSIDGFLLIDSSIPECTGFTGMGWFVFISLGLEPKVILSNSECLTPFYIQTAISVLFAIGVFMIVYTLFLRNKEKTHFVRK